MVENTENTVAPSELQGKIIRQVEYYFGDVNLSKDKFMKEKITEDDGWLTFECLLTFKRLAAISDDVDVIKEAIRASTSGLLEISEDGPKLRRVKPLPEFTDEYKKELRLRTVHLKGFPTDTKLDDIFGFCGQYGEVESISMRRLEDKSFKGCIFCVYKEVSSAEKAVAGEEKYADEHSLLRENKEGYIKRKAEYEQQRKLKRAGKKNKNSEKKEVTFDQGLVLKLFNVKEDDFTYNDIKDKFKEHSKVKFVDILKEKQEAIVRFESKDDLESAIEKMKPEVKSENEAETIVVINDKEIKVEVMSGDEEKEYWVQLTKILEERQNKNQRTKRRRPYHGGKFNKRVKNE